MWIDPLDRKKPHVSISNMYLAQYFKYDNILVCVWHKYEGEKNTRRGGLNCVLKNFYVPYVEELFSGSESEVIQSLSEFRVVCSG